MEDKENYTELDETLVEISELLESISLILSCINSKNCRMSLLPSSSMLLRVPEINHDFSSLDTETERESDVEYKL